MITIAIAHGTASGERLLAEAPGGCHQRECQRDRGRKTKRKRKRKQECDRQREYSARVSTTTSSGTGASRVTRNTRCLCWEEGVPDGVQVPEVSVSSVGRSSVGGPSLIDILSGGGFRSRVTT